jgi:hypothetical protein
MTSTLSPLEPIRQVAYLDDEGRMADDSVWKSERVYFPHCHRCITDRVRELASFSEAGWDGVQAKPIDPNVIEAVCQFFDGLADEYGELFIKPGTETVCLIPHCVPLVSGGLQLEWHVGERILELEFETPDTIRYLKWWPGHDLADDEASYPAADLHRSAELIRWAFKGEQSAAL